jgi:hypothetical protein
MPYREGQTATNPSTGQTIVFRGGQWVSTAPQVGANMARRLSSQDQAYLSDQRTAAQQAADAERASQRFLELNQKQGTGQIFAVPGISEITGAFNPAMSEMEALTNRMAPALRQPGSGAMSDKDVAMFKKSIPNPNFPGPTNQRLAQGISQGAQRQRNYVSFLERYAQQNGTIIGAQEAWDRAQRKPAQAPQRQPAKGAAQSLKQKYGLE